MRKEVELLVDRLKLGIRASVGHWWPIVVSIGHIYMKLGLVEQLVARFMCRLLTDAG